MTFNWDKIPDMDPAQIELYINSLDQDQTLTLVNEGRKRADEDREVPDSEVRVCLLLVRRLRAFRLDSGKAKKAEKKANAPTLADLGRAFDL